VLKHHTPDGVRRTKSGELEFADMFEGKLMPNALYLFFFTSFPRNPATPGKFGLIRSLMLSPACRLKILFIGADGQNILH
jgi:hypothetical protein